MFPTVSKATEGFLLSKEASGRSIYTIRNYKKELERFSEWIKDVPINRVSSKDLEEYMKYLREDFRITHVATTEVKPRKLSSKSLKNTWGTLSSFWNWASKEFNLENPFNLAPVKAHPKPILPLTLDEIEKLLKACEYSSKKADGRKPYNSKRPTVKRDKAIILTLLDSGIRASELCGIDVKDADLNVGRILVTGKGNKSRYVYLGKISRQAIWRYLTERFPDSKSHEKEPLFLDSQNIHRITRQGVLLLVKRLGEKAGVANVHPYKFRHTFAVQFLRNGGNVFELQNLLGHTDLDMVKNYVKLAQLDLEVVARKASLADNWRLR